MGEKSNCASVTNATNHPSHMPLLVLGKVNRIIQRCNLFDDEGLYRCKCIMAAMPRIPLVLMLVLLLGACASPSTGLADADPYGCQNEALTREERANCGVHLYEVLDEITAGDCSYARGAKTRIREDGGGIAFSEAGFQFVDVYGNYGSVHPGTARNTYVLTNDIINDEGNLVKNELEYTFNSSGFRAVVTRLINRGVSDEFLCVSQSTYTLLDVGS